MVWTSSQNRGDQLKPCGPPWISTTKKAHGQRTVKRTSQPEQLLQFGIIRLSSIPQSASAKIARSAQHFDCKDHGEAKYDSSPPGLCNLSGEPQHDKIFRQCFPLRVNEQSGQT